MFTEDFKAFFFFSKLVYLSKYWTDSLGTGAKMLKCMEEMSACIDAVLTSAVW